MRRICVLTSGGDAPGLNAVIRALVKRANARGAEVVGIIDGFKGLVTRQSRPLDGPAIGGILHRGGTILGTSNRDSPFAFGGQDRVADCLAHVQGIGAECLVIIGGDGSLTVGNMLNGRGLPVVGVPKTIDNDLSATDQTFGFDTAVTTATEALDKLHTTAESHHRVMVLEVMGRYAGWIALASGIAGGADAILLPEMPFTYEAVARKIEQRKAVGKPFSIVVVAEGAKTPNGELVVGRTVAGSHDPVRLGGIGVVVGRKLEELTGLESRVTVLGHVQRGGSPTPYDRILSTRYGVGAADLALNGRYGYMVGLRNGFITEVPLAAAVNRRIVSPDGELVQAAKAIGITFGDE